MNAIFSNFNNVGEFNYSIHISPEFRFIYFNNPKCACTTVKASLNLACATALGRHLEYKNIGDIHNRNQNILLTPAQVGYATFREILEDPSYFKFCFIREPIQRIASAFASKLTWGSKSLSTLNRSLHRSDCALVTFDEFISLLLSDARIRDVDEHWRLQRKQVCFDLVRFDKIGLFENIEIDLKMILREFLEQRWGSLTYDGTFWETPPMRARWFRHLLGKCRRPSARFTKRTLSSIGLYALPEISGRC